ncbi:hypothetical protein MCEMSE15_00351 [Fimbriimonadaceae bacterium]
MGHPSAIFLYDRLGRGSEFNLSVLMRKWLDLFGYPFQNSSDSPALSSGVRKSGTSVWSGVGEFETMVPGVSRSIRMELESCFQLENELIRSTVPHFDGIRHVKK